MEDANNLVGKLPERDRERAIIGRRLFRRHRDVPIPIRRVSTMTGQDTRYPDTPLYVREVL